MINLLWVVIVFAVICAIVEWPYLTEDYKWLSQKLKNWRGKAS